MNEIKNDISHVRTYEQITQSIPVEKMIDRFRVTEKEMIEVLHEYPVLNYLLGSVSEKQSIMDTGYDGIIKPVQYLTDGSGLFGLTNQEDALRWKDLFNHMMGGARHAYFLADVFANATVRQQDQLKQFGYNTSSLAHIDKRLIRDIRLVDHAGRRQAEERKKYGLQDATHAYSDSYLGTIHLLEQYRADPELMDLLKSEAFIKSHVDVNNRVPDIIFNIITYSDLTFDQTPTDLTNRFVGLRERQRESDATLSKLELCSRRFESDMQAVFGMDIIDRMKNAGPYEWETRIRKAYAASSGLSMKDVFPNYQ